MKFTLLANRDEVHVGGQIGASLAPRRTDPGGRVPGQYQTLLPRLPRSARVGAGEATLLAPEVAAVLLLAPKVATDSLLVPLEPHSSASVACCVGINLQNLSEPPRPRGP